MFATGRLDVVDWLIVGYLAIHGVIAYFIDAQAVMPPGPYEALHLKQVVDEYAVMFGDQVAFDRVGSTG